MVKVFVTVFHSESYQTVASYKLTEAKKIYNFLRRNTNADHEEAKQAAKWCRSAYPGMVLSSDNYEIDIDEI